MKLHVIEPKVLRALPPQAEFDVDELFPPGPLRTVTRRIVDTYGFVPSFTGMSLLTYVAAILGTRVFMVPFGSREYANLFVVLVAPSTRFHKSTTVKVVRSVAKRMLDQHGAAWGRVWDTVDMTNSNSVEALIDQLDPRLEAGPCRNGGLLYIDEFGADLDRMRKGKSDGRDELLRKAFDGNPHSTGSRGSGERRLECPVVSVLGTTTLEDFQQSVGERQYRGGLLPRCALIPAPHGQSVPPRGDGLGQRVPAGFYSELAEMLASHLIPVLGPGQERRYEIPKVGPTYDAWALWHEQHHHELPATGNENLFEPIWDRHMSHVRRIAMVFHALGASHMDDEVGSEELSYATRLVDWIKWEQVRLYKQCAFDAPGKEINRALAVLEKLKGTATRGDLGQKHAFRGMSGGKRSRTELRDLLEEDGYIEFSTVGQAEQWRLLRTPWGGKFNHESR